MTGDTPAKHAPRDAAWRVHEDFERIAPPVSERTAAFWHGGADGVLRICRCAGCERWIHPPLPVCPACGGAEVRAEPVSGRATVRSWTINRYPWSPSMPPPYIVAEVELDDAPGVRMLTNIVEAATGDVHIGAPVQVAFAEIPVGAAAEPAHVYVPLFRLVGGGAPGEASGEACGGGAVERPGGTSGEGVGDDLD